MSEKNLEDNEIEPAPKLIEVVLQSCRGQVDHWVEPYIRITVERLHRAERPYLKCLLVQVIANALYYNASLTLNILQKLGVATEIFNHWFQMLRQTKKSGVRANFKREHDKKVCCLGLTSLLLLSADQLPGEALERVFKATLDLLVAYKDQVAEAAKEGPEDDDDMNNGLVTYDNDDGSDKDMGDDDEDVDEASSLKLQNLAAQARAFRSGDDYDDDSDDDFSDDEELQSPIDEVDPFVLFVDTLKALQASDPTRFRTLSQTLDFHYQALTVGVAQHAEHRRSEIQTDKAVAAATTAL